MGDSESHQRTIKIYNWKFQPGDSYINKSPIFSMFVQNIELKWQLQCIFREVNFFTSTQVARDSRCVLKYYSEFPIHVIVTTSVENIFDPQTFEKSFTSKQNIAVIKYGNAVDNSVPKDVFNVMCRIEIDESQFKSDLEFVLADKNICRCTGRIVRDFECLVDDEKTSDMILRMEDGRELHAHKAILSSQSSVFAGMCDHDTLMEKRGNIVEIKSISYDLMKRILLFIYTGKVGASEEIPLESLYVAADMYDLDDLKNYCSRIMIEELNVTNSLQYLELAHTFKDERLKSRIMRFVLERTKEIVKSKEFQQLHDADLMREMIVAFMRE